ncbi:MAG: hypothetical protein ACXQS8_10030, partial [Candidatus Helarchaeales archaeon]
LGLFVSLLGYIIGVNVIFIGEIISSILQYKILIGLDPDIISGTGESNIYGKAKGLYRFIFLGFGLYMAYLLLLCLVLFLMVVGLFFFHHPIVSIITAFILILMTIFIMIPSIIFLILGTVGHILFCVYLFILGDELNVSLLKPTCFLLIFIEPIGLIFLAKSLKQI